MPAPPDQPSAPTPPDQPSAPTPPSEPTPRGRDRWLTPGGLSAIAAVVGCLVAVASLILTNVIDLRPETQAAPSASSAPPSVLTANLATNQLFVYGSTKPGQPRYPLIQHYVLDQQPDSVTGYLYDSGQDYPLAKFGPGEPIEGVRLVIHPESEEEFFAEMTRMESGLFALKQVRTTSGALVRSFEWIGPTDGLERIDHWPR